MFLVRSSSGRGIAKKKCESRRSHRSPLVAKIGPKRATPRGTQVRKNTQLGRDPKSDQIWDFFGSPFLAVSNRVLVQIRDPGPVRVSIVFLRLAELGHAQKHPMQLTLIRFVRLQ